MGGPKRRDGSRGRKTVLVVLVSLVAVTAEVAAAAPPCGHVIVVPTLTQRGPTCAVAAVAMAASGVGQAFPAAELAREVPVWRDGVSFFDLEDALAARGLRSMTFQGDATLAARFIAAGVPVVAAVELHGGKHALTLAGYEGKRTRRRCTRAPVRLSGIDPWAGAPIVLEQAEFERAQFGQQLFVLWPQVGGWEARIARAGIDLAPLAARNRRFRAEELVLRASEHPAPNDQMVLLLERAVSEDPTWEQARVRLAEVKRALAR